MSIITKISACKRRVKRANIYLDSKFALSLPAEIVIKEGLHAGQELDPNQLEKLTRADCFERCLGTAIRFLSYRPRSESEIRQRLQQRGFDSDVTDSVAAKLKEQGLIDDTAFALFWRDNRESFKPRSRWLTGMELRHKGLSAGIIDNVMKEVDDSDSAYKAAAAKASRLNTSDYDEFRRRVGEYLRRRGFNYEVIKNTVARTWKERDDSPAGRSTLK
jgi:regulatory protein